MSAEKLRKAEADRELASLQGQRTERAEVVAQLSVTVSDELQAALAALPEAKRLRACAISYGIRRDAADNVIPYSDPQRAAHTRRRADERLREAERLVYEAALRLAAQVVKARE